MPYSNRSNEEWVMERVLRLNPSTTLDVGPGAGAYGHLMKRVLPSARREAVEIWAPYIKQFDLPSIYDEVFVCDARIFPHYDYDLVFLGDVLEHMTAEDARKLWDRVSTQARAAIISVPIIHYPQGEYEGNPYEAHVEEDWTTERILDTFPGITENIEFEQPLTPSELEYHRVSKPIAPVTGTYLAEFECSE